MKFGDLSIAKKISISFGAIVTLVIISFSFLNWQMMSLHEAERLSDVSGDALDSVYKSHIELLLAQSFARKFVLTGADADRIAVDKAISNFSTELSAARSILLTE